MSSFAGQTTDARLNPRFNQGEAIETPIDVSNPAWVANWLAPRLNHAKSQSVCPISGFSVGALALTQTNRAYYGTNMEWSGVGLESAIHSEQFAVAMARRHGETKLSHLFVTATPCGYCRQFLLECGSPDLPISVLSETSQLKTSTLEQLLPEPFTLAQQNQQCLNWHEPPSTLHLQLALIEQTTKKAASQAYAPYTQLKQAIAVLSDTHSGIGTRIESSAFNPSLSALQAALSDYWSLGGSLETIHSLYISNVDGAAFHEQTGILDYLKNLNPNLKCKTI